MNEHPRLPEAVFLCDAVDNIGRVYGAERIQALSQITRLNPNVFTGKDIDSDKLASAEIVFSTWGMPVLTPEQVGKLKKLRCVCYAAGATDSFCRPFLKAGVHVLSAWQANARPVAEFVAAQILLGLKNYFRVSADFHQPQGYTHENVGCGVYGARIALIGAGAISTRVRELLANFNLEVTVVPSRPERRSVSLEEVFQSAQVVSNHLPDRDDNVGVLNGKLFASMKRNGVFINTGRGRQVNEKELIEVLERRGDLTALLDVTYPEPPAADSKLYTLPNVRLSPHIAGSLNDETHRMADYVIADLKRFLNGEPLLYEVAEDMLLTSR